MRRYARLYAGCVLALTLAGCASVSDAALSQEVTRLVGEDRFADRAMAHMEKAGFICTVGGPADVECSRERQTKLIVTCIQRVFLVDARPKNQFSGVRTSTGACFGGFG